MDTLLPTNFTHLRVYSHYSLLQGTASVRDLVRRAEAVGMQALALTDSHGMYGAVAFAQECRQARIHPITGMTFTVSPPLDDVPDGHMIRGYLVLLATGPAGYQSLCRLTACLQAHPDRETRLQHGLAWEDLKANHRGLLCIEAGQAGWLAHYVRTGRSLAASRYAGRLGAIFTDRCYVGLEIHRPEDEVLARALIQIGGRFGMQPVVAQPVTCIKPKDAELLPLLAAIDRNCRVEDVGELVSGGHWLDPQEINDRFSAFPAAIANVSDVIRKCQPALPSGATIWPALDLPATQTAPEALLVQARDGLERCLPSAMLRGDALENGLQGADYKQRLERELTAINEQSFAPLFLLVADIVRFAREQDIPVSTRGSVANSLVAFALDITTVDPVEQGLLFERFLNPARANLPDIDLDFCSRRRDEVLTYVRNKFGENHVALVGTMNTLQPKSAVREVAKVHGVSESRIKQLSALVPRHWHPDPRRRELPDLGAVLTQLDDETERDIVRQSFRLVGQPHHLSLHPGGIIITPGPLTDVVPVQWATKGFLTTQYDYRDVEAIGLPKIDLLGIRALTVLADAAESIRTRQDPEFRLTNIPLDDPATAELLTRGDTIGVFQCESSGAQRTLRQLQACTIRDLALANAFFKPGPATGGMAPSFIRRYRGEEEVSYLHPSLQTILEPTKGVLLFQEQVLRIAVEIAGLSWQQADHLRRGMSKFRAEEMALIRRTFVRGCVRTLPDGPGLNRNQAETLWEQVMAFAGYGFNQGHATAYADVSYRSAYLKVHYPAAFMWARLMDRGGFHHPAIYIAGARRLGITVRPPHVNVSRRKVTLTDGEPTVISDRAPTSSSPIIWLGLGQVRNLRRKSIETIEQQRPFASLRDLLDRVSLRSKEIHHLIQCGALDGLSDSRSTLLAEAAEIMRAGSVWQMPLDLVMKADIPPESASQRLEWERHILGLPVSVNPLELIDLPTVVPLRQLFRHPSERVTVAGVRLPGWTGGKNWFLSDGDTFVMARGGERPPVWQPQLLNGRYRVDEWGGGWFQVEEV